MITYFVRAVATPVPTTQTIQIPRRQLHLTFSMVIAQYVNCAAANPGADTGMYDASDQYKLSTWTQVPHREIPFRDKGGLRRQGQKRVLFVKDTT